MIPILDLQQQYNTLKPELDDKIQQVLSSCQYVLGPAVTEFENAVAHYLGVEFALGVASGTDALLLALKVAGIGPGDEVITSPFSMIAHCEALYYLGAKPRFVDIDPRTFNMDIKQIESAITDKTKGILPIHIFGQTMDMPAINAIANRHNLLVIEDCAQSIGAGFGATKSGGFGELGCFSFYPSKNLGCYGDGGLITTNDRDHYEQLLALRNHGSFEKYKHEMIGYNSRLDAIQGAILSVKLPHLDHYNGQRQSHAALYNKLLKDTPIKTPEVNEGSDHIYHQYTILAEERDELKAHLLDNGIGCAIHYPTPIHKQPVFAEEFGYLSLPNAESVSQHCLSLPMFPELKEDQITTVANTIKAWLRN